MNATLWAEATDRLMSAQTSVCADNGCYASLDSVRTSETPINGTLSSPHRCVALVSTSETNQAPRQVTRPLLRYTLCATETECLF